MQTILNAVMPRKSCLLGGSPCRSIQEAGIASASSHTLANQQDHHAHAIARIQLAKPKFHVPQRLLPLADTGSHVNQGNTSPTSYDHHVTKIPARVLCLNPHTHSGLATPADCTNVRRAREAVPEYAGQACEYWILSEAAAT